MAWKQYYSGLICIVISFSLVATRKHHLEVRDDIRPYIALSTFGFYTGGHLDVKLNKFSISDVGANDLFGLSLDKTTIDQMNPYLDSHQSKCILEEPSGIQHNGPILFFLFDFTKLQIRVQCSPEWRNMHIYKDTSKFAMFRDRRQSLARVSDSSLFTHRKRRDVPGDDDEQNPLFEGDSEEIPPNQAKQDNANKSTSPVNKIAQDVPEKVAAVKVDPENVAAEKVAALKISPEKVAPEKLTLQKVAPEVDAPVKLENKPMEPVSKEKKVVESKLPVEESNESDEMPSEFNFPNMIPNQLCQDTFLPLTKTVVDGKTFYNMSFSMLVTSLHDEGLYNLYFHACANYREERHVSFDVDIVEKNQSNFLSAGEMPLPALYFMMSLLFFLSGLFWVFILKKSKNNVYKIHYIMAVLVFLKSLSLMFHSINYHFIETRGEHVEAWAILYYIAHLLKGAVLFITIVLIGTGWTFIKHILSDKDKKIFMIVIPLQVLANIAEIIIDESEESDAEFRTWRNIFFFVDLLCCGAILFPIVWSIRHLHEASATDGKAAINLRKLKLFRQFYIMIVCYIYFTRIIVYLLKMTVAFQYAWLDEMFHEMATYVFFVLTGYKFRPASSHPYFAVVDEDPDDVVEEVLTESGFTEGLHRTKALNRNTLPATTTVIDDSDEEREILITKRESSHEYD